MSSAPAAPAMPPGMFMDESEVSSRALEAHNSNIAKQREVTHHIRKQKRASSGVAQVRDLQQPNPKTPTAKP